VILLIPCEQLLHERFPNDKLVLERAEWLVTEEDSTDALLGLIVDVTELTAVAIGKVMSKLAFDIILRIMNIQLELINQEGA